MEETYQNGERNWSEFAEIATEWEEFSVFAKLTGKIR